MNINYVNNIYILNRSFLLIQIHYSSIPVRDPLNQLENIVIFQDIIFLNIKLLP